MNASHKNNKLKKRLQKLKSRVNSKNPLSEQQRNRLEELENLKLK